MSQYLLFKAEEEGLDPDEAVELAEWLAETGLVNSRGEYGRFVEEVLG